MIISVSRRTDIPACYTEWFMNRIRAGFCTVPNPFRKQQVSLIPLKPTDIEVIIFWTRNPKPLLRHLHELDGRGYRFYFQFTVLANPRTLDPKSPPVEQSIRTFHELSNLIGPNKVVWRYDPIILSDQTSPHFHRENFAKIASALKGYAQHTVISIVDIYQSIAARIRALEKDGLRLMPHDIENVAPMIRDFVQIATTNAMQIVSCAEELDLRPYGVQPGKCVDGSLITSIFKIAVTHMKDPHQRKTCGCVISKDIGMYDTCPFNCAYCYATRSFATVTRNRALHNPNSPSLIGWHEAKSSSQSDSTNHPDLFPCK